LIKNKELINLQNHYKLSHKMLQKFPLIVNYIVQIIKMIKEIFIFLNFNYKFTCKEQ